MNDVQQAAERVREGPAVASMADFGILANAYLAEHPDDENEPITEDWLRSVGGTPHIEFDDGLSRLYWHGQGIGFDLDIQTSNAGAYSKRLRHIKTRGDVRRLCAALGIELKGE